MSLFKKICVITAVLIVSFVLLPTQTLAADADFEVSVSRSPDNLPPTGGDVTIKLTIKNVGPNIIDWVVADVFTDTFQWERFDGDIAVGATATYSFTVQFDGADLDKDIKVDVTMSWGGAPDGVKHKYVKVVEKVDYFKTSGTVEPEKDTYYIGETITIKDGFRNDSAFDATDVEVEYYHKQNGNNNYQGNETNLGTVAAGEREYITTTYTFVESDIGTMKIAAKIDYDLNGNSYTEYSYAHDIVVVPAPEPTATPVPTATPEPTPTQTPTPTPEATPTPTPEPTEVVTSAPAEKQGEEESSAEKDGGSSGILNDRAILITLIIVVGVIIVLLIVLITVIVSRKR